MNGQAQKRTYQDKHRSEIGPHSGVYARENTLLRKYRQLLRLLELEPTSREALELVANRLVGAR
jgi:hypothetical protein